MKFLKTIRAWWRGLFRKRRFNMLNATDNTEEWHMHLSPASILAGLVAFMLMLFILTLSLVAYSPILEFLPGGRTVSVRTFSPMFALSPVTCDKAWRTADYDQFTFDME